MTVRLSTRPMTALVPVALAGVSFAIAWSTVEVHAAAAGNMKAYMDNTVMPAMQPIWDGSYADKLTDADWKSMQDNAAKLQASVPVIASAGAIPSEQARAKQAGMDQEAR